MRRAGVVLAGIVVTAVIAGCAGTGHTWQDEYTARLEGTSGTLEELLEATHPPMSPTEIFETYYPLARPMEFKYDLVKELKAPSGCEEVQEKGEEDVGRLVSFAYDVPKNLTPELERNLRAILKKEIAELEELEREAASCGAPG